MIDLHTSELVGLPLEHPALALLRGWPRRIGRSIPGARYAEQDTGRLHGPSTLTACCALSSRLLRGYPWTIAAWDAIDGNRLPPFATLAPGTRVESLGTPGLTGTVESSRQLEHACDPVHVELIVRWDTGSALNRSRIGISSVRELG